MQDEVMKPGREQFYYVLQNSSFYFVVCNIAIVRSIKVRQICALNVKSKDMVT
jgi:hypothetical protein